MDHEQQPHIARRSASHGALSSSYATHACASSESGHSHLPAFKPLRIIREHGHTFLDPAASADGMLRKTTETGNIGIFSMYAGKPGHLRPRASLGDLRQPSRPFSRSSNRNAARDDRRRLPSYRDSTSEIISMYGSENHGSSKSTSGTLSPPWDDGGQRSYSMTTCGSKGHSMPRNYGIPQAHDFHAKGQRPRSPYPYPTRLPRPGVRPSSPALTENGHVDYSRMVKIDRFPERTTLHPKSLFPYKTTRNPPPPLSIRYEINQSTRSLTDDGSSARLYPLPLSRRPPLPTHLHPWAARPQHRLESRSSDQSLRTMSLTSTSGGYGRAPTMTRLPPSESKPIFYDYSEDFENVVEPTAEYPIAPTPRRVSSSLRSMIASGGCDANLEDADEGEGDVIEYLRRATMIEDVKDTDYYDIDHNQPPPQLESTDGLSKPACCESADDTLDSSFLLPQFFHKMEDSSLSNTALGQRHKATEESLENDPDHSIEVAPNCAASETSSIESPLEPETPAFKIQRTLPELMRTEDINASPLGGHEHDDDAEGITTPVIVFEKQSEQSKPVTIIIPRPELASVTSTTFPCRYSFGRKDSRFLSLSSGLSDLASFINDIDKHIQAPNPEEFDQSEILSIPGSKSEPNPNHAWNRIQRAQETLAPPRKSSLQRYTRDCVDSVANNAGPVDELQQYKVISTRSGPTLVPQPISPAKMLRVKNSIPQLMKALPPLPDFDLAPDSPFGPVVLPIDIEPFELSRLTDARSSLSNTVVSPKNDEEVVKHYDPYVFDRAARRPKLKLKHAASFSHGNHRNMRSVYPEPPDAILPEDPVKRPSTATGYSNAPVKRRLPIRVSHSRPNFSPFASEDTGTIKRRPGIQKSSTISEIASSQPMDLFSASNGLKVGVHDTQPLQVDSTIPKIHEPPFGPTRILRTAGRVQNTLPDDALGPSLHPRLDYWHSPIANGTAVDCEMMQSFFSENSVTSSRQGLRKTISNLRSRIIESRQHQCSLLGTGPHDEERDARGRPSATETASGTAFKNLLSGSNQTRGNHAVPTVRKFRSKLERLVRSAKHKLWAWGKSKHRVS